MDALHLLTALAVGVNGLLAGVSFEVATVKLPARHRIGPLAYAEFARGADLGNGKVVYPALAVMAAVLTFAATAVGYARSASTSTLPLTLASIATALHFATTAKAAPVMLSLGNTSADQRVAGEKLDRFAHWHAARAVLQVLTFVAALWALAT